MSFLITHENEIKDRFFHVFDREGHLISQGRVLTVGKEKFTALVKGFDIDEELREIEYDNSEAQYFDWYLSNEEMNEALFNKYYVDEQWISRNGEPL